MIGEHTRDFCVDDLGMDVGLVEELLASGALEQHPPPG